MRETPAAVPFLRRVQRGLAPALIVTQREIKDTLRDWRIVAPILMLVMAFPFLANFLADRAVSFVGHYGAGLIVERLYPFLMLVVGFFPSTFSLVIALETFVGEKERSSLEPLLATPLTDMQLYVGKLLAAIVPPVVGSYLAMLAYTLLLGLTLEWWPSVQLVALAFTLSTMKSLVMVTGAVIVSSQSTSVRAANLVASFIIVPMALLLQVEAGLLLYAHYDAMWMLALSLLVITILLLRLGVRIFNREQLLGRDLAPLNLAQAWQTFARAVWPSMGFYRREVPRLIRNMRAELVMTLLVAVGGGLAVGLWAWQRFPLPPGLLTLDQLRGAEVGQETIAVLISQSGLLPSFSTGAVLLNNIRSLLLAAVLGFLSLGTLALLLLMLPVVIIAYVTAQVGQVGLNPWLFLAVTVVPHAFLELPAAIIATAQAMRLGDVILRPPDEGGGVLGIVREMGHFIKLFVLLVVPALAAAAWIEVYVTPRLLLWLLAQAP